MEKENNKHAYNKLIAEFCKEKGYSYDKVGPMLRRPFALYKADVDAGNFVTFIVPNFIKIRPKISTKVFEQATKDEGFSEEGYRAVQGVHEHYLKRRKRMAERKKAKE